LTRHFFRPNGNWHPRIQNALILGLAVLLSRGKLFRHCSHRRNQQFKIIATNLPVRSATNTLPNVTIPTRVALEIGVSLAFSAVLWLPFLSLLRLLTILSLILLNSSLLIVFLPNRSHARSRQGQVVASKPFIHPIAPYWVSIHDQSNNRIFVLIPTKRQGSSGPNASSYKIPARAERSVLLLGIAFGQEASICLRFKPRRR